MPCRLSARGSSQILEAPTYLVSWPSPAIFKAANSRLSLSCFNSLLPLLRLQLFSSPLPLLRNHVTKLSTHGSPRLTSTFSFLTLFPSAKSPLPCNVTLRGSRDWPVDNNSSYHRRALWGNYFRVFADTQMLYWSPKSKCITAVTDLCDQPA